jgi:hypothetical protein
MSTLSDEYHDIPTEPDDDVEPTPEPPSIVRRVVDRLTQRTRRSTD